MGYDLHITRAVCWSESESDPISAEEWHALVDADPELQHASVGNRHFVFWIGHPHAQERLIPDEQAWFLWFNGYIYTSDVDRHVLTKMLDVARRLGAAVQGDNGEWYHSPEAW
jgi:hypothetical protein